MIKCYVVPTEKEEMRELLKRKQLNSIYYCAKTKLMHVIGYISMYLDALKLKKQLHLFQKYPLQF